MFRSMSRRLRPRSFYDVLAVIGCFAGLATGGAYAANTIGSSDVIDESLQSQDIKNGQVKFDDIGVDQVTGSRIKDESVQSADILDSTIRSQDIQDGQVRANDIGVGEVTGSRVKDESIQSADILNGQVGEVDLADAAVTDAKLAPNSVGSAAIATDAVGATEVANDSIDSGEIVDFGLSNQDVGVLFAQVNADGTIANSSGGVTGIKLGTGTYEVDFGHDISACAFVSTQGEAGVGGAGGAITGVTDRAGNAEGVFATTRSDANVLVDQAFQLIVVC